MSILSKEKRTIYRRKFHSFWLDFSHNKIGLAGLVIILLYVVVAIFTPYLTPYRPRSLAYSAPRLADSFAMPLWMTIFPQFQDLPRSNLIPMFQNVTLAEKSGPIVFNELDNRIEFNSTTKTRATILLNLITIDYQYTPPAFWTIDFNHIAEFVRETSYTMKIILTTEEENENWNTYLQDPTKAIMYTGSYASPPVIKGNVTVVENKKRDIYTISGFEDVVKALFQWKYPTEPQKWCTLNPAQLLISKKGIYHVQLQITFDNTMKSPITTEDSVCRIQLTTGTFFLPGGAWGILGTDGLGNDVWTELIYGVRISLIVGILAAVISTSLGISLGAIAGYFEGPIDQVLMRIVDILLCLPVLPLLLILIRYFEPSVYFVIVLIAIFGWQGLSRLVRSRVLSIKEMPYIESARAAGASKSYIITRHLIPNVIPVATASMILAVPGAILTEAALSFLGFSDPNVATWGRMLQHANTQGAFAALAWWFIIPPGIAITVLCLGFVFVSHSLDEIVNPKLRRRR